MQGGRERKRLIPEKIRAESQKKTFCTEILSKKDGKGGNPHAHKIEERGVTFPAFTIWE